MVTAVHNCSVLVRAAMALSTTGGDEDRKGCSWRSPTANPSYPSCSARTAESTTSCSLAAVPIFSPVTGSGW